KKRIKVPMLKGSMCRPGLSASLSIPRAANERPHTATQAVSCILKKEQNPRDTAPCTCPVKKKIRKTAKSCVKKTRSKVCLIVCLTGCFKKSAGVGTCHDKNPALHVSI